MPTKVHLVKAMVFPVVMYGCESWTRKKAERQRMDAFELWCWRRFLRVPWTARSNQSILKEISPEYSLEGLILKLKLQYFGTWCQESKKKGAAEDEMVRQHHPLNGHEFEQTLEDSGGQRSLASFCRLLAMFSPDSCVWQSSKLNKAFWEEPEQSIISFPLFTQVSHTCLEIHF